MVNQTEKENVYETISGNGSSFDPGLIEFIGQVKSVGGVRTYFTLMRCRDNKIGTHRNSSDSKNIWTRPPCVLKIVSIRQSARAAELCICGGRWGGAECDLTWAADSRALTTYST